MEYEKITVFIADHGIMTYPIPVLITFHDQRSAAEPHRCAFPVQVGPLQYRRPAYHHLIGAFLAPAAIIEGYKQVIVSILLKDKGAFDGAISGRGVGDDAIAWPGGQRHPLLRLRRGPALFGW